SRWRLPRSHVTCARRPTPRAASTTARRSSSTSHPGRAQLPDRPYHPLEARPMEGILGSDTVFLGSPVRAWLLALLTALVVFIALAIAKRLLVRYATSLSGKTRTYVDDVVRESLARTRTFFILFISIYAGSRVLLTTPDVARAIATLVVLVVIIQIGIWGNAAINTVVESETKRRLATDPNSVTTL